MKYNKSLDEELDIIHSGIMALEELLIKKKIITLEELNPIIKKLFKQCRDNREKGKKPKIQKKS